MSFHRRWRQTCGEHMLEMRSKSVWQELPQPPKPGEDGISTWRAIIRWAMLWKAFLHITDVEALNAKGSQPTGVRRKRLKNRSIRFSPLCCVDTICDLDRKLRTLEAWCSLSNKVVYLILYLSRIKVKREYGMALLYKKASRRFIPQFLLPTIWKSCIAHWQGRYDAGVRCLLCVIDGKKCRQKYVYRRTLIRHICRVHFFISEEQLRQLRSTPAPSARPVEYCRFLIKGVQLCEFQNRWNAAGSSRLFWKVHHRAKSCPATEVNFQRRVCRHCAFRGCAKCDEGFDGSQPNMR